MPVGTIGAIIHTTRKKLLDKRNDEDAELFLEHFGFTDGDMIEFFRKSPRSEVGLRTNGRVTHIEDCFFNGQGGYTAFVKVLPILQTGQIGNTIRLQLTIGPKSNVVKNGAHCCSNLIRKL